MLQCRESASAAPRGASPDEQAARDPRLWRLRPHPRPGRRVWSTSRESSLITLRSSPKRSSGGWSTSRSSTPRRCRFGDLPDPPRPWRETASSPIPVFPSRSFRHNSIYVHSRSGIERPEDLKGSASACPSTTSRLPSGCAAMLQHEYGIPPSDIRWFRAASHDPGRIEKARAVYRPACPSSRCPGAAR